MAQIASLLAVATIFIGLCTCISAREGGLIHETKLPMQLELKMQGGIIAGFYGTYNALSASGLFK